jgi:hypothetical protein
MTTKLGVKISPRVLELLVRVGARVTGSHDFAARLTENGIPENYHLVNSGVDRETGDFFLVFAEHHKKTPGPVAWQAPVYEKEDDHEFEA